MSKTVFCKKYQQEMEALDLPPMPGPKGKEIMASISKKAWKEWLDYQTMLINEKHLNLMDPSARKYLTEQMDNFFRNDSVDTVEGYVPPK